MAMQEVFREGHVLDYHLGQTCVDTHTDKQTETLVTFSDVSSDTTNKYNRIG